MRKYPLLQHTILILPILLLSACMPSMPAPVSPTHDPTGIAIAAEATVTAMAISSVPAVTLTSVQLPTATSPAPAVTTPTAAPQTDDFWVVYLAKHKLNTINKDGTKKAQLTNTPSVDYLPTWSPDGKVLAFIRFEGSNHQDGTLHLLTAGSNTPRILGKDITYNHFIWTADSQQILATSGWSGAFDVHLIDVSGKPAVQVAKSVSEYPRLSPDGKKIALLINTGALCDGKGCILPNDLFLYDIATGQTTRLTGDALPKVNINWAPDGSQIAYHLAYENNNLVEILQPDGKLVASKADPPWWRDFWLRSPDGSQIAFYVNDTSNNAVDIYTVPGSGSGEKHRVTRLEKSGEMTPFIDTLRWRPDGSGVIFNMWTGLYTVNLDGSGLRAMPVTLENIFFDVRPTTDSYTPAPDPTPPATWKLCPGGLESRLDIGRKAQVTVDPPTPNNVRQFASKAAKLIGQIQPGEEIEITGGPICDKGLTWWEIRSLKSGLKGYTLEGDLKSYWLVPLP